MVYQWFCWCLGIDGVSLSRLPLMTFWFRRASRCFKLRMLDTSIHPQTGTLCCRKPQPKTYSTQQLYLMASSLLHVVSKVCSIQNMRSPISLWIFTDTEYCTYWHLAVMEYQCLRHGGWQDGHLMFPLFVFFCFFVRPIQTIQWSECSQLQHISSTQNSHRPYRPDRSLSESWTLFGWGMFLLWVSQLVTNFQHLTTGNLLHVQRSVSQTGLESWREMEKQRAPWCQCSICLGPCHYPSAKSAIWLFMLHMVCQLQ